MSLFKLVISGISLLTLAACGGGGESDSSSSNPDDTFIDYSVDSLFYGGENRMIVGASFPLNKSLHISVSEYLPDNSVSFQGQVIDFINTETTTGQNISSNFSDLTVTATSSNTAVVSIENGKLVGAAPGKANIQFTLSTESEIPGINNAQISGEITVCPYESIAVYKNSNFYTDNPVGTEYTLLENSNHTTLHIIPIIDIAELAEHSLTLEDCPQSSRNWVDDYYMNQQVKVHYENPPEAPPVAAENSLSLLIDAPARSTVKALGIELPNITINSISETDTFSNFRITQLGFDGDLVIGMDNPFKVIAFSNELNQDIDITSLYSDNTKPFVSATAETNSITLSSSYSLPNLSINNFSVLEGFVTSSLNQVTGSAGSWFQISAELQIPTTGKIYDVSSMYNREQGALHYQVSYLESYDVHWISNRFSILNNSSGSFSYTEVGNNTDEFDIIIGNQTPIDIQGRWVQADTGEDHYIGNYSLFSYTTINDNQITYQTTNNETAILLRAGIDNVAVSGSVNVIEETTQANNLLFNDASSNFARSINPTARSLSGIGSMDLILKNVNTGDETDVTVAADGTFNEEVPTGVYDVVGTVVNGEITYTIDTQITVEKDATDTGKLNLAKVGLYNFDISLSGCQYDYKCYAGQEYTFTITAKNTGLIASSGIQATIGDISGHANVATVNVPALPITGAARGDSISYSFTATFSQPAEDIVIEIPITLTDTETRTWEDTVKIKLSKHTPLDINILAYNAGISAEVRGYLMLEGRTPIRVSGTDSTITIPNNPGASYELILANQVFNQETPYGVANNTTLSSADFTGFNETTRNESSDDTAAGAQPVNDNETFISYISAGDVDHYIINIPVAP